MIGERIRALREQKGLTQGQLAEIIGNDGNTISRWERNKIGVGNKYIAKLADALDTSIPYLMGLNSNVAPVSVEYDTPLQTKAATPREQIKTDNIGILRYRFGHGQELEVPDTPETAPQFWARVDRLIGLQPAATPA